MITIDTTPGMCTCACGLRTSRTASFRPGHDAKLKGALKRGERTREPIVWVGDTRSEELVAPPRPVIVDTGARFVFDEGWWVVKVDGAEVFRHARGARAADWARENGIVFPAYDPRSHERIIPGRDELHRKER